MTISRRVLLGAALALPLGVRAQQKCVELTPEDMEGPFYKPGAPSRGSLYDPKSRAEKLVLGGVVRLTDCKPVANLVLDFWHADAEGSYDHAGFRYRGVVRTDAQGRYTLETNLPPPYMGRPRHIHVKLQRPGGKPLTTQLYFPGEARGADPGLIVKMENRAGARTASFDFVLI